MASFPPSHPGQRPADGASDGRGEKPEEQRRGECLPQDVPRARRVVGADQVGDLYRESRGRRRAYPAEEPCGRRHQPDGCRGVCPEASDHRGVDVEHHDDGQLCQNGGNAQPDDQVEPLAPGHRLAGADQLQQFVFSLFSCIHRRSAVKTTAKIVFFIGPALFAAVPAPRQASFADRRCSGG